MILFDFGQMVGIYSKFNQIKQLRFYNYYQKEVD